MQIQVSSTQKPMCLPLTINISQTFWTGTHTKKHINTLNTDTHCTYTYERKDFRKDLPLLGNTLMSSFILSFIFKKIKCPSRLPELKNTVVHKVPLPPKIHQLESADLGSRRGKALALTIHPQDHLNARTSTSFIKYEERAE